MKEQYNLSESAAALGISEKVVAMLLKQLIEEKQDYLDAIKKALNPLDYNALSNAAHKLKGPAINLRVQSIARLAEKMEAGAKKLEPLDYESLLIGIEEAFDSLSTQI